MSHPLVKRDKSIQQLREEIKARIAIKKERQAELQKNIKKNPYLRSVLDEFELQDEMKNDIILKQRQALEHIIAYLHNNKLSHKDVDKDIEHLRSCLSDL
jgi:hypothetical protein